MHHALVRFAFCLIAYNCTMITVWIEVPSEESRLNNKWHNSTIRQVQCQSEAVQTPSSSSTELQLFYLTKIIQNRKNFHILSIIFNIYWWDRDSLPVAVSWRLVCQKSILGDTLSCSFVPLGKRWSLDVPGISLRHRPQVLSTSELTLTLIYRSTTAAVHQKQERVYLSLLNF